MKLLRVLCSMAIAAPLLAQDPTVLANVDEAFRLAGVRSMLESLPAHVNEVTAAAVTQVPRDKRQQFEPLIKETSAGFLQPDAFYRQLRSYFARHYDAAHMGAVLALQKTPVYRTMQWLEESASTPAARASRKSFDATVKADPPSAKRLSLMKQLDEARNTTGMEVRIVSAIMKALSASMADQVPATPETQTEFQDKIRPVLSRSVLLGNLFTYRNTGDAQVEEYIGAVQQKNIAGFNQNLQAAIVAVAAQRAASAGESLKTKMSQPFN